MNKTRKIVWGFVLFFTLFTLVSAHEVNVPCQQCGHRCIEECVMARCACNFQDYFVHFECIDEWCEDNPARFDADGNIIWRE